MPSTKPESIAKRKTLFLDALRKTGNVTVAASAAGVGRRTAYVWCTNPEFKLKWDEAQEEATERLEAEAWRRAVKGVEEPVYQGKELVGHVTKYSDTLLIFLLKANAPEKYKDRSAVDVTTKGKAIHDHAIPVNVIDEAMEILYTAGAGQETSGDNGTSEA